MSNDETMKKLEKLTKTELLKLIELMMNKNNNNYQLINNKLNNKNPKSKLLAKKIRKKVESPDGSYYEAYRLLSNYIQTSTDTETILELSKELLEYYFIEIEAYGHRCPETLYDFTLNTYEIALQAANELKDLKAADDLYYMIRFEVDELEEFYETFREYFDVDNEDNIIFYE